MKFGFLPLAALLFAALPAYPQDTVDDSLIVQVSGTPANPIVGGNWIMTVLIDHPVSQEVAVRPPHFPPALLLERARTEVRYIRPPAAPSGSSDTAAAEGQTAPRPEPRRWTAVEFLFSVKAAGTVTLEPVMVTAKGKYGESARFTVRIAAAPQSPRRNAPVLRWEQPPASLVTGKEATITLVLQNWNPASPVPRNLFGGRVPERFILEEQPFIGQEGSTTIRYPFRIIALEGENLVFGPLTLEFEGERLEVPRISIPVIAAAGNPAAVALPPTSPTAGLTPSDELPETRLPFPKTEKSVFPLFTRDYDQAVEEAAKLWAEDRVALSLALIRSRERDKVSGPLYTQLRKDMETRLGLSNTGDETWVIWKVLPWALAALAAVCAVIIKRENIFGGFVQDNARVTNSPGKGYNKGKSLPVLGSVLTALLIAGMFVFSGMVRLFPDRSAILLSTEAYRVPDSSGAVSARFEEGQPVAIRSSPPSWYFVETEDGKSGWVPSGNVIFY